MAPEPVWLARAALRLLALALLLAGAPVAQAAPQRLVSLAPSITEMVHALGLTDRLVGVSRFCDYPPTVAELTDVGGFTDPAYETIVRLAPDLVLLLDTHEKAIAELGALGIDTLALPHQTIADIHVALREIGAACGAARKAEALVDQLEARTAAVGVRVAQTAPPSVLRTYRINASRSRRSAHAASRSRNPRSDIRAARASASVRTPDRRMLSITTYARSRARSASRKGEYRDGAFNSPASVAACSVVNERALRPKYVCAAASTP